MKKQLVVAVFLATLVVAVDRPADPTALSDTPADAVVPPAGYVVHIDPATEAIVEKPVFTETYSAPVEDPMNYSTQGLVVQENPIGGGSMVDLRGRFRNTSVATINSDGTVSAPCLPVRDDAAGEQLEGAGGEDR